MSQMRRLFQIASRAFLINLMLVLCLHVFPPVAFFCPLGTGFATGWSIAATCPGPLAAMIGEGRLLGLAVAAGIVGGALLQGALVRNGVVPSELPQGVPGL